LVLASELLNQSANATKRLRAVVTPERSRNFLLGFDHAHVSFRMILITGNGGVVQKKQGPFSYINSVDYTSF
jgi:hypothetical protein